MERVWQVEYEKRRNEWKSGKLTLTENSIESGLTESNTSVLNSCVTVSSMIDSHETEVMSVDSADDNAYNLPNYATTSVSVQQPVTFCPSDITIDVDPTVVSEHWSLNSKQCIAYQLIVEQSLRSNPDLLSTIITGAAGTGKSRIIHAAQDFLSRKNQLHRFRLASFTGIAAQNIDGVTLHLALCLSAFRGSQMPAKTRETLIRMWTNMDFLFVDEYSMIGCKMMYKIHLCPQI